VASLRLPARNGWAARRGPSSEPQEGHAADEGKRPDGARPRRRFVATTDGDHDGPIFPNLAENIVPTNRNQLWVADITPAFAGAGSTSLSRPASSISLRSSTPGHDELSAMRSASGSMHVWRLPHCAPPSRHAGRHQGASITPTAVRSMPPKIIAPSLPGTASRVRWVDAATHTTTPRPRAS